VEDPEVGEGKKANPKAINDRMKEFVRLVHGAAIAKQKVIDDFKKEFPECTKNSIERKLEKVFTKEKKGEEPKRRWFAQADLLEDLEMVEEAKKQEDQRYEEIMAEVTKQKEEAAKIKEEKKEEKKQEKLQEKKQREEEKMEEKK